MIGASEILRLPSSTGVERVKVGSIARQQVEPVRVEAHQTYTNLGVKWYGEGVFAREPKIGAEIKGSTLYRVKPGQFIYNRMFVTEGSFGLVTDDVAHGVVSNEFPAYELDTTRVDPQWFLLKFQHPATVKAAADQAMGGTKSRRRWKEAQFEAFEIDLPSLDAQRETVRILSRIARLVEAISAELEARQRQFEFYRGEILSFPDASLVRRIRIDELASRISSGRNSNRGVEGELPVYGSTGAIGFTDVGVYSGDFLLVARVGANAGLVNAVTGEFDVTDNTIVVEPGPDWDFRFAFHQMVHMNINQYAKGGGQPLITGGLLKTLVVPFPAIEEQRRIGTILDRFDALVNDRSIGLPAELAARRKQYGYYRDKLLTSTAKVA